jgi:hypothetical protein
MACDWFLRRTFGECPDEKWDHYLANYAANRPDREGTFQPLRSFWDRLFRAQTTPSESKDSIFSPDEDMKTGATDYSPLKRDPYLTRPATDITAAKKARLQFQAQRGRRKAVKFDYADGSDSDEEFQAKLWSKKPSLTALGSQRTSNGGSDDTDCEIEKTGFAQIKNGLREGEVLVYPGFEEGATQEKNHPRGNWDSPGEDWSPGFLRKHRHASATTSSRTAVSVPMSPMLPPPGAVPVTPSLMKALDRVAAAQQAAFVSEAPPSNSTEPRSTDGLPTDMRGGEEYTGPQWDVFWKDVRYKARH